MSPVPFPATAPLLAPITEWCLDTFEELSPLLIGAHFGADNVSFIPVELDPVDPLSDLDGLMADPTWDVVVLIVDVLHTHDRSQPFGAQEGLLAHGCDRERLSITLLDVGRGPRRTLRQPHEALCAAADRLFTH